MRDKWNVSDVMRRSKIEEEGTIHPQPIPKGDQRGRPTTLHRYPVGLGVQEERSPLPTLIH